jgi:MFS transporter, Spinster family, sphingosine-1-phosphate transporter
MKESSPTSADRITPLPGARNALILLLAINLFNYIDRQVLSAVLPKLELDASLFSPTDPYLKTKLGSLTTAFMVSYMLLSPLFGWFGDRRSRWLLVGSAVIVWSLASGATGLATTFVLMIIARCLVGTGEAAYGPVAPSMLSDMYPAFERGRIMALFYLAIPVGSALGFVLGGQIESHFGWRAAFLAVVLPGLLLGVMCFFMREPPREQSGALHQYGYRFVLTKVLHVRSYQFDTVGYTLITFVLGGVAAWTPSYIFAREAKFEINERTIGKLEDMKASNGSRMVPVNVSDKLQQAIGGEIYKSAQLKQKLADILSPQEIEQYNARIYEAMVTEDSLSTGKIGLIFGAIVVVSGLGATLLGGYLGDKLRLRFNGAYFLVSGISALLAVPFFVAMLYVPFPYAWGLVFLAVFGLFVNTGPTNTILANVIPDQIRATAFALNILIIHALGDAISPILIGFVADVSSLHTAFLLVSILIALGGLVWIWGARYLERDTQHAPMLLKS